MTDPDVRLFRTVVWMHLISGAVLGGFGVYAFSNNGDWVNRLAAGVMMAYAVLMLVLGCLMLFTRRRHDDVD